MFSPLPQQATPTLGTCHAFTESFGPRLPVEVCPSVWLGSFGTLTDSVFLNGANIHIIINCAPTHKFLRFFNSRTDIVVPSNVMVLNLDPHFNVANLNEDEQHQLTEFNKTYNRVLQNYLSFFYKSNDKLDYLMHNTANNSHNLSMSLPMLTGNLFGHLFNINRFIRLCRNIDANMLTLVVSEYGDAPLSSGLLISILMDNYNLNFEASYKNLMKMYPVQKFNTTFYDDLLIIDTLKKFYHENCTIKQMNPGILTTNHKLKRRNDEEEHCFKRRR